MDGQAIPPLGPPLEPNERRVLGVLVEKALATPEYYPMTVNAIVAACNQKNNRDPVMQLYEPDVVRALKSLEERRWVATADISARVTRWRHLVAERLRVGAGIQAILAELLLRGPQQPGELRTRACRMSNIATPEEMTELLNVMTSGDPPLAVRYPRVPGERYDRWGQTLSPDAPLPSSGAASPVSAVTASPSPAGVSAPSTVEASLADRVARLEAEVQELRAALAALRPSSPPAS